MADILSLPRKRRTRAHVIADISVNHVERFVYEAGFTAERFVHDYGLDLIVRTFDRFGYVEPAVIKVQVKAVESAKSTTDLKNISLRVRIEDVHSWRSEPFPVLLILYEAPTQTAFWLYVQRHFQRKRAGKTSGNANSISVQIPKKNKLTRKTLASARRWKNNILNKQLGSVDHG